MKRKNLTSLIAAFSAAALSFEAVCCDFKDNTLSVFAESSVMINEVCSQNKNSLTDSYGAASDWIEFYNNLNKDADISGWSLTDSSEKPFYFPENTIIPSGSYFVIFAGGGASLDNELHTDFGLSKSGERLTLYDKSGSIVQMVDVPSLLEDQTYSYDSASEQWSAVNQATPNKANIQGVSAPIFMLPSGFYDASQQNYLEISGLGEIYYTLDGSDPKTSSTAVRYTDKILLTDRTSEKNVLSLYGHKDNDPTSITIAQSCYPPKENVDKIYTFRAVAKSGNNWSSEVNSTYIVMEGEKLQKYKDIPIISVTTDSSNLFDASTGIYVVGEQFLTWLKTNRVSNEWDSSIATNFYSRGKEWERPAIVSMFRDGEEVFTQNAGIRIRGNSTRNSRHKSFSIFARSEYGDSKFNYKIIEGNVSADDGKKIKKYDSFAVRANTWVDRIRDAIVQEALEILPDDATLDRDKGVMFIDGEFWGYIDIQEKYSDYYFQSNYGIPSEDVAYLKDGIIEKGSDADQNDYDRMIYFASESDMSKSSNYKTFTDEVDVETFADHFAVGIYTGMWDWPNHNYVAWRNNGAVIDGNKYSDGKWRFGTFDFDYTSALSYDTNYPGGAARYNHFDKIYKDRGFTAKAFFNLMNNSEFREIFVRRFCDMGNIVMSPDKMRAIVSGSEKYQQYLMDEYLRWGSDPNMNKDWAISSWIRDTESDRQKMIEFYRDRPNYAVEQMCSFFNLSKNIISTEVSIDGEGEIKVNNIPVTDNITLKYPESTVITLSADAPEGHKFVGWKGDITSSSETIEVTVDKARTLTAVFAPDTKDYYLYGDVNCDKTISIADLVMLQSWVLNVNTELKNWKNADLTEDGIINSADITALRKMIITPPVSIYTDKTKWGVYYNSEKNGQCSISVKDKSNFTLDVTSVGVNCWYAQAIYNDFQDMKAGERYRLTYTVSSNKPTKMLTTVQQSSSPNTAYFSQENEISQTPQTFVLDFVMQENCPKVMITYSCGYDTGTYKFSDVTLYKMN